MTGTDVVDITKEPADEPSLKVSTAGTSKSTDQTAFARLVKRCQQLMDDNQRRTQLRRAAKLAKLQNPSSSESNIDADSQSTENDVTSQGSQLSGHEASRLDAESNTISAEKKCPKVKRVSKVDSTTRTAEDYARKLINKKAKDPSFGVDKNGFPLSEEQIAEKIIENEVMPGDNEQKFNSYLDEKYDVIRATEEVI
ncbi:hypothetical protein RF11_14254 [Thelohanellus kitauei]|uniref:Uncharacterized protein n=1 Tax=Thelohanellus kitauei TaxID=669202 RepID=A0A0C2MEU7_THEKT|nr:hypothetical protein RF11_14254 [Thelohanellus kitauei]